MFKNRTLSFIVLILSILCFSYADAQPLNMRDSIMKVSSIQVQYSYHMPGGDMKTRFGNSSMLGGGFLHKTKQNYFWGFDVNFLFGNNLNERYVLDSLKTTRGQFITIAGEYGDVRMFERGFVTHAKFGKLFPISKNKNSGILVLLGLGFMEHKMQIEVLEENVESLDGDKRKGYDRLTNGISTSQFVGYWFMNPNRRFNFYAGLDFYQGYTMNRRDWDYHAMRKLDEKRFDALTGLRFGVVLPLYKRMPKEYYFR